jgi:hypothetical protein
MASLPPNFHINPLSISPEKTVNHWNGAFDAGTITVALKIKFLRNSKLPENVSLEPTKGA